MKISAKTRYGLRALVDLAIHDIGSPVPLINIANRQEISINYLEQVFALLKKANIVRSIKGAQGGYILARKSDKITVADVIRAIEGDIMIVEEEPPKNEVSMLYQNFTQCLQEKVWNKITDSVNEVVNNITIESLVRQYQENAYNDVGMYYI